MREAQGQHRQHRYDGGVAVAFRDSLGEVR